MKKLVLILAAVALSAAQNKPYKGGKHGKGVYIAASPGSGGGNDHYGPSQYEPASYNPKSHYGGGSPTSKPAYPLLIADTRTLNQDGTIDYNFQADNGLQQGETVDPDGTRRGFYSYPGADGKTLTVKYTAGKNGFIASGDHLPLQPQAAPYSDKDDQEGKQYSKQRAQGNEGQYNPRPRQHHSTAASRPPPPPPPSYGGHQPHQAPPPPRPSSYEGPSHYSSQYSSDAENEREFFGGGGGGFPQGGSAHSRVQNGGNFSPNFPAFEESPRGPHVPKRPKLGGGGFTADNPYQSSGAGPYNGNFDLGNSGHFSINFTPGTAQEYQPEGPGYGAHRNNPHGHAPRGQY